MKKVLVILAILVAVTSGPALAQTDVPPQIAAYTGTWEGVWANRYGNVDHTLIVGQFTREGVTFVAPVTYIWGDIGNATSSQRGGQRKTQGVIEGATLRVLITTSAAGQVEYQMTSNGRALSGVYRFNDMGGHQLTGVFKRKELTPATSGYAVAEKPSLPKVEAPKALEQVVVAEKPPQKPTQLPAVTEAPVPSKAAEPKPPAAFDHGDVLRSKISNVKVLGKPSEVADTVSILAKGDEVIFLGKEQDGFVNVETAKGGGWVKKILVTR